jgi:hypothetical protein
MRQTAYGVSAAGPYSILRALLIVLTALLLSGCVAATQIRHLKGGNLKDQSAGHAQSCSRNL